MTTYVPLHGKDGLVALVDDEDAPQVLQYRWYRHHGSSDNIYAYRNRDRSEPGPKSQLLHQLLTGWDRVDHINGNGLDNRRENLRSATRVQNSRNSRKRSGTTSQFKGVSWKTQAQCWIAQIYVGTTISGAKHKISLGCFRDEVEAAHAYDAAARRHFGEFATLNFPRANERGALPEDRDASDLRPRVIRPLGTSGTPRSMTEDQVRLVRRTYALGGVRMSDLAREFEVSLSTIRRAIRHERYRDVVDNP